MNIPPFTANVVHSDVLTLYRRIYPASILTFSRAICCFLAALVALTAPASALEPEIDAEREAVYRANRQRVTEWTEAMLAAAGDNPDQLVQFGLSADRQRRQVRFWAEATGIQAGNALEFVLISQQSGHDYEALAVAMVKPSAIHDALEFIGMKPGLPVDPAALRFWPKGERVLIRFGLTPEGASDDAGAESVYVEELVADQHLDRTLPADGFVFTGSSKTPHPRSGEPVYAADHFGPHAIVSLYNEPFSVLDVPRIAAQGSIYGSLTPNPERILPADALIMVTMQAECPPERPRVFTGRLHILTSEDEQKDKLRFSIEPEDAADRAPRLENATLIELLAWLGRMETDHRDPFIAMRPDTGLAWPRLRDFYQIVQELEGEGVIRIEPPEENQVYHRAFLPAEWFRDRANRPMHPDELHLEYADPDDDVLTGVWKRFEEEWPDQSSIKPIVHIQRKAINAPDDLTAYHTETGYKPRPAVLLLFAPRNTEMKALHDWMLPLQNTYPTQYLFEPNTRQPPAP